MKINARLKKIGDLVEANSFCLDVGCDHALLDIYLVSSRKNIKAVASDMVDTLNKLGQASQQNLNNISNTTNNSNFTQNIYANNQPSRLELYRQTKNLLKLANA